MLSLHQDKFDRIVNLTNHGCQTFLLVGDTGTGKRTLIHRIIKDQRWHGEYYTEFGVEYARVLKRHCLRVPTSTTAFLIDGDAATIAAYNAVLKLLEEPPTGYLFFITSAIHPILTIVSRCSVIIIPRFSDDELFRVLKFKGMSDGVAKSVIPHACGSTYRAFNAYDGLEAKRKMIPYLKALYDRNEDFVMSNYSKIKTSELILMRELVNDVIMARYGMLWVDTGIQQFPPNFMFKVRDALSSGSIPGICWLRAWFKTSE